MILPIFKYELVYFNQLYILHLLWLRTQDANQLEYNSNLNNAPCCGKRDQCCVKPNWTKCLSIKGTPYDYKSKSDQVSVRLKGINSLSC